MAAGHSGQFTPMRLPVNTVIQNTLVGLEPTTFRSLVRRATSSATEPTGVIKRDLRQMDLTWEEAEELANDKAEWRRRVAAAIWMRDELRSKVR